MNPQSRDNESQDARNERWKSAQRMGEFRDEFTGGLTPVLFNGTFLVPDQNYIDAENARRERRKSGR